MQRFFGNGKIDPVEVADENAEPEQRGNSPAPPRDAFSLLILLAGQEADSLMQIGGGTKPDQQVACLGRLLYASRKKKQIPRAKNARGMKWFEFFGWSGMKASGETAAGSQVNF